jgi:hypothetical protein
MKPPSFFTHGAGQAAAAAADHVIRPSVRIPLGPPIVEHRLSFRLLAVAVLVVVVVVDHGDRWNAVIPCMKWNYYNR